MPSNTNCNSRKYSDPSPLIHFQKYIYRIALFTLLTCCCCMVQYQVFYLIFTVYPGLKIQASGARRNDDFLLNTLKTP